MDKTFPENSRQHLKMAIMAGIKDAENRKTPKRSKAEVAKAIIQDLFELSGGGDLAYRMALIGPDSPNDLDTGYGGWSPENAEKRILKILEG